MTSRRGCSAKLRSSASTLVRALMMAAANGSRCVWGDGTALSPSLIFQADSMTVQSKWVSDIDKKKHSVYTAVSPSGRSNDDAGLGWVEQVFNPLTKEKARRKWRLLIMDGHSSHTTMDFLSHCAGERILVLIYPPAQYPHSAAARCGMLLAISNQLLYSSCESPPQQPRFNACQEG